jgi:integrase
MPRTFTETWIQNLKPPGKAFIPFKEAGRRGFLLRAYAGGARVFFYQYSWRGRTEFLKLREWSKGSNALADAHREHAAALDLYIRGINPKEEREREARTREVHEQHELAVSGVTVRNVIAEWGWHYARPERKHPREGIRLLKVYLAKPWKGRPVRDLVKRDAVLLLDRVKARAPVMANRVYNLGLQAFNFAIKRDLISNNPFLGIGRPGGDEPPRDRKLNADEVRVFWSALATEDAQISAPVRLALKLILVTAQRPGEVAGAEWSEIDTEAALWTIPANKSKNGRAHRAPLSDLALELIAELRGLAKDRPHLLPSVHSKLKRDESLSQRALSRALKNNHDKAGKLFGLEAFTPHDLRRTAASMMTTLGIQRLHVSKILNHTDQDITGAVYDLNDYGPEKTLALTTWADHLRAVIAGKTGKVTPIRKGVAA